MVGTRNRPSAAGEDTTLPEELDNVQPPANGSPMLTSAKRKSTDDKDIDTPAKRTRLGEESDEKVSDEGDEKAETNEKAETPQNLDQFDCDENKAKPPLKELDVKDQVRDQEELMKAEAADNNGINTDMGEEKAELSEKAEEKPESDDIPSKTMSQEPPVPPLEIAAAEA